VKRLILITLAFALLAVSRVSSQSPSTLPLVQAADLVREGAFRLPGQNPAAAGDQNTFNGGGEGLGIRPDGSGLYVLGSRSTEQMTAAEVTIPTPGTGTTLGGLPTAAYKTAHVDPVNGQRAQIGCGGPLGDIFALSDRLLISAYCYYDAANVQIRSHWVRSGLSLNGGTLTGPHEIASYATGGGKAGWVSRYMAPIPAEWQALLGGDLLVGNTAVPILSRTSWGQTVTVTTAAAIGSGVAPGKTVLGFTDVHNIAACQEGQTSTLYTCADSIGGVEFIPGTRSVLFFGGHSDAPFCYGTDTNDPAKHLQADGEGGHFCYDPPGSSKGNHIGPPYVTRVWAFDANDLVAVKNGTKAMWDVRPYAQWDVTMPFATTATATDPVNAKHVGGTAYDPATKRLYLSMTEQDAPRPLIQVFKVNVGTVVTPPPPPPPPPPADTDGDGVPDTSDACPTVAGTGADGCPVVTPPPPPPPPPVDACVAFPGVLTVTSWPGIGEGSRSVGYRYDVAGAIVKAKDLRVEFNATRSWRVTLSDERGCVAMVSW